MSELHPTIQKQLQRAYQTGVITFRTLDNKSVTCKADEINVLVYNENTKNEHIATVHHTDYPVSYAQLKKLRWFLKQQNSPSNKRRKYYDYE